MPNNPTLYKQRDIQPLQGRYQDVNKNEIKFLGRIWAKIEYNGKTTKLSILITQRNDITPLLGVNWLKQLPITINKILLDEKTSQSEDIHTNFNELFETNHTIKNTEIKIQIKPGSYPIQQKARAIPYHLQDVKNELDRLVKSGHLERLETIEEDCFVSPVVITVKKDKTVKVALVARKLNESCVKKGRTCQTWKTTKPNIHRTIKKRPQPNMDFRGRSRFCLRTNETSPGNQQTLQLRRDRRKHEWILPIPKRFLRSC